MLLTTLLLCGATSIASSQTNEGTVNPDKTKTEQTLSDADKEYLAAMYDFYASIYDGITA